VIYRFASATAQAASIPASVSRGIGFWRRSLAASTQSSTRTRPCMASACRRSSRNAWYLSYQTGALLSTAQTIATAKPAHATATTTFFVFLGSDEAFSVTPESVRHTFERCQAADAAMRLGVS